MNKQEAIELIKNIDTLNINEKEVGRSVDLVIKNQVLEIVSKIYEPQKVVIPKFVAEWYDCAKKQNFSLRSALEHWSMSEELEKWFQYSYNQETFARAWLDGYVEKEQLYEITVPNTSNYKKQTQHLVKQGGNWFFCGNDVNRFKYRFTKGQIEAAGFGWVFEKGFAKEVDDD